MKEEKLTDRAAAISLPPHIRSDAIDMPSPLPIASATDSWHLLPTSLLSVSPLRAVLLLRVHKKQWVGAKE